MTEPIEKIDTVIRNDSEHLPAGTDDLQKQLNDAKATIAVLVRNVIDLKTLGESAMSTMEREAEKSARLEAEIEKTKQRSSKDKESLVRQVENFRAQLAGSKMMARILECQDLLRYCDTHGRPNDLVPGDIRKEQDWIGALIKAYADLETRKNEKRWGGLLEIHAKAELKDLPPKCSCACPVCILRWNVQALSDDLALRDKKIKILEEENRCHRREKGPQPADKGTGVKKK